MPSHSSAKRQFSTLLCIDSHFYAERHDAFNDDRSQSSETAIEAQHKLKTPAGLSSRQLHESITCSFMYSYTVHRLVFHENHSPFM